MGSKGAAQAFTIAETDRALLSTALGILSDVAGTRPIKPMLSGTQASVKSGKLRLIATDAISAVLLEIPVEGADGDYGIIPIADFRAALATFGDGSLKVSSQDGRADLTCGKTKIRLALHAGDGFPDILSHTPDNYAQTIELSTQALVSAAKAAAVLSASSRVVLKARQGKIVLLVNTQELGSFQTVGGDGSLDCELMLDGGYLEKARAFDETIKLHINDAKSTIMIESASEGERSGWRYWVAPMVR
jgi:DNA polymerase III sliding clamp (beta) subunit (PCNA family)